MEAYITKQQKIRRRTVRFWIGYFLMLAAIAAGLYYGLGWLEGWLADFEAAQPKAECQRIFDELFSQPDWDALYAKAGIEDTVFESGDAFAAYMGQKTDGAALTYYETSAGLSGDHKYIVTAGGERIAIFTLTQTEESASGIPAWKLGNLEFVFRRARSVTVCTDMDTTVYINNVPLDETYTVRTLFTEAEKYLPEGMHGLRMRWQYVPQLLTEPQILALDSTGNPVELRYDEASATYFQSFPEMTVSQEQTDTVVAAAKIYCRYMIGDVGKTTLKKHFDSASPIYKAITQSSTWMQNYSGFSFSDYTVSSYYRYSKDLYSLRLVMTLNVKRTNGTVKEYPVDATFFLENRDGTWRVREMTNVDVQKQTQLVRLIYVFPDGTQQVQMFDTGKQQILPPEVSVPPGKQFTGWYTLQTDEAGNSSYTLIFMPDETGSVYLSENTALTHMTLYPLFEDLKEEE